MAKGGGKARRGASAPRVEQHNSARPPVSVSDNRSVVPRWLLDAAGGALSLVLNGIVIPLLLAQHPQFFMSNPYALPVAVGVSLLFLLPYVLHFSQPFYRRVSVRFAGRSKAMVWSVVLGVGAIAGAGLSGLGYALFLKHSASLEQGLAESQEGFNVTYKTELLDMDRGLDDACLWVLYRSGYADTISPVALTMFIEVTNLYSYPVSISSYSLQMKTESCGWMYMPPIDARGVELLWSSSPDLKAASVIDLSSSNFSYLWSRPLEPHATRLGMLLFDTATACDVRDGSLIQLRLEITDSTGKTYSYPSPEIVVLANLNPGRPTGHVNQASLQLVGRTVDASKAHRRHHSDPIPNEIGPSERGVARIVPEGKIGTIVIGDGAFVVRRRTTQP